MIVYGEREEIVDTQQLIREPLNEIRYGQIEAGIVDALFPECDRITPLTQRLRRIAIEEDYESLRGLSLPEKIRIRPQEGFAYYALYPEQYVRAARRFAREQRPSRCVVIGIRSIGTTLSAAVVRALDCPCESWTVRPRGHPFDRNVLLDRSVRCNPADWFLIVDEGPGLSGSSFTAVAEALNERGVPEERIVFFPSHEPDPDVFCSERAQARWPRHRKYVEPFDAAAYIPEGARDLSGGAWRDVVGIDVPVQPAHERRKYLHGRTLWKFGGLAHYGERKLARSQVLEEWIVPSTELRNGFLLSPWHDRPRAERAEPALLYVMARYLDAIVQRCGTGQQATFDALLEMIRVNTGLEVDPPAEPGEVVAVDGRMLPHEWVQTRAGWRKTDALDHHDDHFFPGSQDIAWDIAGAVVEFGFDPELLLSRMQCADEGLQERLPFYKTAYLAYRIGYCTMAGSAFDELKARYLRLLGR